MSELHPLFREILEGWQDNQLHYETLPYLVECARCGEEVVASKALWAGDYAYCSKKCREADHE